MSGHKNKNTNGRMENNTEAFIIKCSIKLADCHVTTKNG